MSGGFARSWFENIFGFKEGTYLTTRSSFSLHSSDTVLCCKGKRFEIGKFEILTVEKLRLDLKESDFGSLSGLTFKNEVGDFKTLHFDKANAGAIFQVSSRLNCLQMEDHHTRPSDGVSNYASSSSQGGACALSCPAALIYRNYLYGEGQGFGRETVDLMNAMASEAKNTTKQYWRYENGLCVPSVGEGIKGIASTINASKDFASALLGKMQVGVQWDTQVYDKVDQKVCQVFSACAKVARTSTSTNWPTLEDWAPFARLILEGTYEGTLLAAAKRAAATKKRVSVFLTVVGGGSFGNPDAWIAEAIGRALARYQHVPLDVRLVHPEKIPDGVFRNLEGDSFGLVDGKLPAELAPDSELAKSAQCERIKTIFTKFDTNANGQLEREEFYAALKKLDPELFTEATINTLLKAADADSDGSVDYTEFLQWVTNEDTPYTKSVFATLASHSAAETGEAHVKEVTDDQYARALKICTECDLDKDGAITRDEMTTALKSVFPDVTELELDKLTQVVDLNEDGIILFEEFLNWLRQAPQDRPSFEESLSNIVPGTIGAPKSAVTSEGSGPGDPTAPDVNPLAVDVGSKGPSTGEEPKENKLLPTFTHELLRVFEVVEKKSVVASKSMVDVRVNSSLGKNGSFTKSAYDGTFFIIAAAPTVRAFEKGYDLLLSKLTELSEVYGHILSEFSGALKDNKDKSVPTTLRMPPISVRDSYMHSAKHVPDLTWAAVSLALARLGPEAHQVLDTTKIQLCCDDPRSDDLPGHTSTLASRLDAFKAGLQLEGSGKLKERMGGYRWLRKDNDPEARFLRLMCFMDTQRAISSRGYELSAESGSTTKVSLSKVDDAVKGTQMITAKGGAAKIPPQGGALSANLVSSKEYEEKEGIGGYTVMEVAEKLTQSKGKKVAAVNAASAYHAGGGCSSGGKHALEEAWCTVSTLFRSIQTVDTGLAKAGEGHHQHIPVDGCLVTPNVEIFRAPTSEGYSFLSKPVELCGVLSVAMFNRNPGVGDSPLDSPDDPVEYIKQSTAKFEACIVGAVLLGAEILVLPDIGCGVFKNDPVVMGGCFGTVLQKYTGYFETVILACGNEDFITAAKRSFSGEDPRESCVYGIRCDKIADRAHLARFSHPRATGSKKCDPEEIFDALAEVVGNAPKICKPLCRYGRACHTRTPEHLAKYEHPDPVSSFSSSAKFGLASHHTNPRHETSGGFSPTRGTSGRYVDGKVERSTSNEEKGDKSKASSKNSGAIDTRPICKYGEGCYNNSEQHLKEYAHPWKEGESAAQKQLREDTQTAHELLNLAKHVNWDNIFAALKEKPNVVNIRPESRDFGLIHFAVFNLRHEPAERLLTEFKADVHLKTKDGRSPLSLIEESIRAQPPDLSVLTKRMNEELFRYVKELDQGVKNPVTPKAALARSGYSPNPLGSSGGDISGAKASGPKKSYATDGGPRKIGGTKLEVIRVPTECEQLRGEYSELTLQINSRPVFRQLGSTARHFMYFLDDEKWGWVIHNALDDECTRPLAYLGAQDSKPLRYHPCDKRYGVHWTVQTRTVAGNVYQIDRYMGVQRSITIH